jgi:hypothetical protein
MEILKVPQQYSANPQLSTWVIVQRRNKRTGTLGIQCQDLLDAIGFEWGKEEEIPQAARTLLDLIARTLLNLIGGKHRNFVPVRSLGEDATSIVVKPART